jgi:GntR family transcriptional regulator, histidine utilization repressor
VISHQVRNGAELEKVGFREIKQQVFKRIRAGEWGPGTLLPGEVELAVEFGCARATVNRAMQELSDDGIIERRRKGGSRVKQSPARQVTFEIPLVRVEIESLEAKYDYKLISDSRVAAPRNLQARLGLSAKAQVRHIKCLHLADGKPYQFEDRWINLVIVPRAKNADFATISPNEWLVQEVPYTNAEVRFSATSANTVIARHLRTEIGSSIFTAERTTWLAGKPVTNVRLYFAVGYQMVAKY